jgi:hypothetical protein
MPIAWPHVVQYLADTLPTLPGWEGVYVSDGPMNTRADPVDTAMVGHVVDDTAGSFTQEHLDDFSVAETGSVRVALTCKTGADSLPLMRIRVFELLNALDIHLRGDQTLGDVLSPNGTVLLASENVQSVVGSGVAQTVIADVAYTTQTYL